MEKSEFVQLFMKFTQNSIPKRQAKKKAPKSKTN
jgi:hypothetical protein